LISIHRFPSPNSNPNFFPATYVRITLPALLIDLLCECLCIRSKSKEPHWALPHFLPWERYIILAQLYPVYPDRYLNKSKSKLACTAIIPQKKGDPCCSLPGAGLHDSFITERTPKTPR